MRRIFHQLLMTVGCLLMLGYFGYHGIYGKHGLKASRDFDAQLASLKAKLEELERKKTALEHRISLLLPQSLDPDMLDESARGMLNFAHPNDLVILRPDR